MSELKAASITTGQPFKILIIDDDPLDIQLLGMNAQTLGYLWQSASNVNEALLAIKEAEEREESFVVATIDMEFETARSGKGFGKTILRNIKSSYPNIACIIISGSGVTAHEVLDLRDDYGLDYYISKDRLDLDTLERGIRKALNRVRPLRSIEARRKVLEETLEKYKDVCAIYAQNLAKVQEKKAKRGSDVSVDIENQIEDFAEQLEKARNKVQELEEEIKLFEKNQG